MRLTGIVMRSARHDSPLFTDQFLPLSPSQKIRNGTPEVASPLPSHEMPESEGAGADTVLTVQASSHDLRAFQRHETDVSTPRELRRTETPAGATLEDRDAAKSS